AVVEFQSGPQPKSPGQTVAGDLLRLYHLALRLQGGVDTVEGVPYERGGVAHHILGAPYGIEIREVRLRHKTQGTRRGPLRQGRHRKAARRRQATRPGQSLQ